MLILKTEENILKRIISIKRFGKRSKKKDKNVLLKQRIKEIVLYWMKLVKQWAKCKRGVTMNFELET